MHVFYILLGDYNSTLTTKGDRIRKQNLLYYTHRSGDRRQGIDTGPLRKDTREARRKKVGVRGKL